MMIITVNLEKSDVTTLLSLVALETERCSETDQEAVVYRQRLMLVRAKLLSALVKSNHHNAGDGDLPDFREYAQKRYPAEFDEDLITMVEDLIEMRRQGVR